MDWPRDVILSEVRQRRKNIWHPLYVESKKKWYRGTHLQNRKRLTDLENEIMVAGREGIVREFEKVMNTLLYSKWISNKDLLYSTCKSTQHYVPAWIVGGGGWGKMGTCLCMAEPLGGSPETTTLLIGYTPIQFNLKFEKIKRNIILILG